MAEAGIPVSHWPTVSDADRRLPGSLHPGCGRDAGRRGLRGLTPIVSNNVTAVSFEMGSSQFDTRR